MPDTPSPDAVRAALAAAALGVTPHHADARVGSLALRPHQRHAAARLRYALAHYRVALLADDVGLGKTAVALTLLRSASDALVVAPAALRPHWTAALDAAGLHPRLLATEALARTPPRLTPRLIVVDEAHHFRNPRTRRWHALATLAANARLLLLSATPVHNRPDDLAALLALTLGARAHALDAPTLARLVVRRTATDLACEPSPGSTASFDRPAVAPTIWLDLDDAPAVRAAINTLPPTTPPADGTATPDLDRYTLLRLWTSSDAALRAALRRRLARTLATADELSTGHLPTRAAIHALTRGVATDPTAVQLALLPPAAHPLGSAAAAVLGTARLGAHAAALRRLLATLDAESADEGRIAHLRAIRARHPGARIVAFSTAVDTVRALYRALAPTGRVAMLTASGGRIASGPLSRAETLARFAPAGQHRPPPTAIERIDLLLTTDVLSEGLDLRDASVVVHLDLPWTPARLAQRTGRAVRPGAPHPVVHVYAFRPPPAAADELRLAAHARAKRRAVHVTIGATPLEHALAPTPRAAQSPATAHLARDRQLERWLDCLTLGVDRVVRHPPAAVRASGTGYLAVLTLPASLGGLPVPTLVAALGQTPPTRSRRVVGNALAALACAHETLEPPAPAVGHARRELARWIRRHLARAAVTPAPAVVRDAEPRASPAHAFLLARAARTVQAATPAARPTLLAAAATLRTALARPHPAHREAEWRDAAGPDATDVAWLTAAAALVARSVDRAEQAPVRPALRALVLFCP